VHSLTAVIISDVYNLFPIFLWYDRELFCTEIK